MAKHLTGVPVSLTDKERAKLHRIWRKRWEPQYEAQGLEYDPENHPNFLDLFMLPNDDPAIAEKLLSPPQEVNDAG